MRLFKLSYKLVTFLVILFVSLYLFTYSNIKLKIVVEYILIPFLFMSIIIAFITVMFMSVGRVSSSHNVKEKFILNFYESLYNNEKLKKKDIRLFKKEVNFHKTKNRDFAHKLYIQYVELLKQNNNKFNKVKAIEIYKKIGFYKTSIEALKFDSSYKKAMASYRFSVLEFDYSTIYDLNISNNLFNENNYSMLFSKTISTGKVDELLNAFNKNNKDEISLELKSKFFTLFNSLNYKSHDLLPFLNSENDGLITLSINYAAKNKLIINKNNIVEILHKNSSALTVELCKYLSFKEVISNKIELINCFNESDSVSRLALLGLFLKYPAKYFISFLQKVDIEMLNENEKNRIIDIYTKFDLKEENKDIQLDKKYKYSTPIYV